MEILRLNYFKHFFLFQTICTEFKFLKVLKTPYKVKKYSLWINLKKFTSPNYFSFKLYLLLREEILNDSVFWLSTFNYFSMSDGILLVTLETYCKCTVYKLKTLGLQMIT